MKNYITIIVCSFIINSCSYNKIYENRESDRKDAQKVTDKFLELIQNNNKEEAFKLFDQKSTDREKFFIIYDKVQNENGTIKDYTLSTSQSRVVEGSQPESKYMLTYEIKREISNTRESFFLQKEGDSIKIIKSKVDFNITK